MLIYLTYLQTSKQAAPSVFKPVTASLHFLEVSQSEHTNKVSIPNQGLMSGKHGVWFKVVVSRQDLKSDRFMIRRLPIKASE